MPKQIQSFIQLQIQKIQAFSADQILQLIDTETLSAIKAKDPHPFFQAYSIAHEGVSQPKVLGDTSKPIHWTRRAIQSIKNIITKGVKFFFGHNEDNSTQGRKVLGEVVADAQKEIDGKLHHIVISYHSPEVREEAKQYDIVSQEANWNLLDAASNFIADTIESLTGIAMGSSKNATPAFAGAKRLGMIQALENNNTNVLDEPKQKENKMPTKEEVLSSLSFHDLKPIIERMNIFPSQLFSVEQLKADRNLTVFKDLEEKEKQLKDYEEKNKNLIQQTLKADAENRFKELLGDKNLKLTDKQKDYLSTFKSNDFDDLTDAGLVNFRDRELDRFKRMTAVTSAGQDVNIQNPDTNSSPTDSEDYTKAENNELLDEDIDY